MRNAFVNTVLENCRTRPDIFIISGDAGLGVFDEFKEKCSCRFLNLGVAEQNTISFSAGMALTGYKVYVYNIIPFLLYRSYEQVRNDICYQELPVVLAGIGSGVTYAPQGMTHYSVEDLGIARTLPNLTVFSPIDPCEARLAALYSLKAPGPVYVRLAKRGEPKIHKNENFDITSPVKIASGDDVALVFHGSIAPEALEARRLLAKEKIDLELVSVPMVQPLAFEKLCALLGKKRFVVSLEEHFVDSGLGARIMYHYRGKQPAWKFFPLGIEAEFIHHIKSTAGMRSCFGISGASVAAFVRRILKK